MQGGHLAVLLLEDNKIIAEGSNKVTSSNDPTAHAEVVAIREACNKLGVHLTFQTAICIR